MKRKIFSISVISLFPDFLESYLSFGIIKRAIKNKLVDFRFVDMRQFGEGVRKTVDDRPSGGGLGMLLKVDVLHRAIKKVKGKKNLKVILLTPQGQVFNQAVAKKLSEEDGLIFVCGRYEGFDERVRKFVDYEISIGDYVLMGGELPALVISEAVLRLVPSVLGKDESSDSESHTSKMLEYPQYTKPNDYVYKEKGKNKKISIPEVLLSGDHGKVKEWRESEALKRTQKRRPDLLV